MAVGPQPPSKSQKAFLLAIVILPILGLVVAVHQMWNRLVDWPSLAIFAGFYGLSVVGVGAGYHRMLAHRSFDAPSPVRFTLLALGAMALEGPPNHWAATHVKHHARSDQPEDPHSPLQGFWHAHVGWLFRVGQRPEPVYYRAVADDGAVQAVSRTFWVWAALGFVLPFAIGGLVGGWTGAWHGLVWGGLVRVFFNHHVTWSVNSVCHTFGRRAFPTKDESRNEWIVGLLAFGEGWHNNHHAFPSSAVHGLRWYQFDLNGLVIRGLAWLGLAWDVHTVPPQKRILRQAP